MDFDGITVHTDGGARGNPGPAASACVIEEFGELLYEGSLYLGETTNNVAEYKGVIIALDWLGGYSGLANKNILFILDSELVVKQIKGLYKVRDEKLFVFHKQILEKIKNLKNFVDFKNVPRKENKRADFLVNQELDKN